MSGGPEAHPTTKKVGCSKVITPGPRDGLDMSTPPGEYYTQERWQNWLDRIR
jgi:hypothetical protein